MMYKVQWGYPCSVKHFVMDRGSKELVGEIYSRFQRLYKEKPLLASYMGIVFLIYVSCVFGGVTCGLQRSYSWKFRNTGETIHYWFRFEHRVLKSETGK